MAGPDRWERIARHAARPFASERDAVQAGLTLLAELLAAAATLLVEIRPDVARVAATHGGDAAPFRAGAELPAADPFWRTVLGAHAPLAVGDTRSRPDLAAPAGVVAYLGLPVLLPSGRSFGVLAAVAPGPAGWTPADVEAAEQVAGIVAQALEREALSRRGAALAEENRQLLDRSEGAAALLAAILDTVDDAVTFVGPDRRYRVVSAQTERYFGVRPEDALGRRFEELEPDVQRCFEDSERFLARVYDAARDRRLVISERFRVKHPAPGEVVLFSAPVHVRGEYRGRLYLFRDITRERAAERAKADFVAAISHELRTPLTSIQGFAELLGERDAVGPLTETQAEFIAHIRQNTSRLIDLVNALIDVARLDAERIELRRRAVSVAEALGESAFTVRAEATRKGLRFDLALADPALTVDADPERLHQILTNLLANAVKFTPAGGSVEAGARPSRAESEVDLWVRDSGPGIAAGDRERIFERFYRTEQALANAVRGIGAGLYLSRRLAELHGGRLTVESAPGEGSTFTLTLPRA